MMNIKDFKNWTITESNDKVLDEGLIHTYPLEVFKRKILRFLGAKKVVGRIKMDMLFNILELTLNGKNSELYEVFSQYADSCGYLLAQIILNKDEVLTGDIEDFLKHVSDRDEITFIFESKFDKEFFPPEILYHVTLSINIPKIMKSGLVPRTKSKLSYHPSRVYFTLSEKAANLMIREFRHLDSKTDSDYTILKIKTAGLKVKFMEDPNSKLSDGEVIGIYTYENIHPKFIIN